MDPTAHDAHDEPARKQARGARTEVVTSMGTNDGHEVRGTVRIAPAVLIELIELTVRDIPGVVELRQRRRRKNADQEPTSGKAYDDGKVRVCVDRDQIEADLAISVARGTNIPELARTIQRRVGIAAGRMLGMTVRAVNISIDDIVDPAA